MRGGDTIFAWEVWLDRALLVGALDLWIWDSVSLIFDKGILLFDKLFPNGEVLVVLAVTLTHPQIPAAHVHSKSRSTHPKRP